MTTIQRGSPGDGITKSLVLCPTDVQPLLGVVSNALCDVIKVVAELAQHVTRSWVILKDQAQVVEPNRARTSVPKGGGEVAG